MRRGWSPRSACEVDRVRARFGAWYSLVPRSWGGLAGVQEQLPAFAELGFDVVYLLPIHPVGTTNRKGKNNTLVAGPDDPGSPYGIGSEAGGHDAVHPSSAPTRTSARCAPRPPSTASTSRWTSPSTRPPTTRGSRSTRTGSTAARTGR